MQGNARRETETMGYKGARLQELDNWPVLDGGKGDDGEDGLTVTVMMSMVKTFDIGIGTGNRQVDDGPGIRGDIHIWMTTKRCHTQG